MNLSDLQARLKAKGYYSGVVDGLYGPMTKAAILRDLTEGPDTRLTDQDYFASATRLGLTPAHVMAIKSVESAGHGFEAGRPLILFEPHRFSKATGHRFDGVAPDVSYPTWDAKRYPGGQDARYAQLLKAIGYSVDAGFASASYGLFQVLGENYAICGFANPYEFASAHARDEATELQAFEKFLIGNSLVHYLQAKNWLAFALRYNGPLAEKQGYPQKLAAAYARYGGA